MSKNVDLQELAKFEKLAAHWWDENGELKTLHQINPLRVGFIQSKLNLSDKKVVDIGCGGGILCEALSKLGAQVTGIDMNSSLIEIGKLHQLESKTTVNYLCTSAEDLARTQAHTYDVVTCLEMLEHVPDPMAIVAACSQLVKPGGHLFFSTINRNPRAYLFAILGAEYILKLLPKNTHDYAKFIRPSELDKWLREFNLITQSICGINYQPLTKRFKLSDDISVNYLLHATSL